MPELPEVETICQGLLPIVGSKITIAANYRNNLRFALPDNFAAKLKDRKITGITRRAKYILINLDNATTLLLHLGMSGRLVAQEAANYIRQKHDHIVISLSGGKNLVFNDPRRFGMADLVPTQAINQHKLLKNLGPEPLNDNFNGKQLYTILQNRKTTIKQALMNAHLLVGVGNIYASEALFGAKISPLTPSNKLSEKQCEKLATNIKQVLNLAIKAGGSTLRDYVAASGEKGYFQHQFNVYGKDGMPCANCGDEITKIVQSGRSTFYCSSCQK